MSATNWTLPATINEMLIDDIEVSGGFASFSYYESLFSPHITAYITFLDTGSSVKAGPEQDVQERYGTLFSSKPDLETKDSKIKITHLSGSLDFSTTYPLKITKVNRIEKDKKQALIVQLYSTSALINEETHVNGKYYNKISNSVKTILNSELLIPSEDIIVDETLNSESFEGKNRRPFDLIRDLCPKSISLTNVPGYVFYEAQTQSTTNGNGVSQNKFRFKALDVLLNQAAKTTYLHGDVSTECLGSNFRIIDHQFIKDGDIMKALRSGTLCTRNVFFNKANFEHEEIYVFVNEEAKKIKLMGSEEVTAEFQEKNGKFTRTFLTCESPGKNEVGITTSIINDARKWKALSTMRYNLMYRNVLQIIVPCNLNLKAGDMINCGFPKSTENPELGVLDEKVSGKYLILHLSHQFNTGANNTPASTTHMTLVRDTYGLYTIEDTVGGTTGTSTQPNTDTATGEES